MEIKVEVDEDEDEDVRNGEETQPSHAGSFSYLDSQIVEPKDEPLEGDEPEMEQDPNVISFEPREPKEDSVEEPETEEMGELQVQPTVSQVERKIVKQIVKILNI